MAAEPEAEVPDTGAVLTFGRSRFAENQASRFWIKNDKIVACSCGDEHTVVVAESHRVFAFGTNEFGQLGLGHNKSVTRPSCIKALKSEKCQVVGCGKSHTVVGTEDGKLFAFGLNQDGQLGLGHTDSTLDEITRWSGRPVQLGAGVAHTAALTADGRLFTWGSNSEGQCGLGDSPGSCFPTLVPSDEEIVNVSCGYRHTAFVTAAGELFTCGENDEGQLGVGDRKNRNRPALVPELQDIARVACGGQHTLVLLESGEVFCFGAGDHGQLGLGSRVVSVISPHRLPLADLRVRDIAAGHCHSAIVTEDGRLLTFGDSRHGKLCSGEEESNVFVPRPATELNQLFVTKAVLGGCQSMVLVDRPKTPGMLRDLPPLTNGQHDPDDLHSAARQRRREKEMSLPPLGRTLPPLKGAPRPSNLPAQHEDEIQPDSGLKPPSGDTCELQSVSSMTELRAKRPSQPSGDEPDSTKDDDEVVTAPKKEGNVLSRFFKKFRKKKSKTPVKDKPPEAEDEKEEPDVESRPDGFVQRVLPANGSDHSEGEERPKTPSPRPEEATPEASAAETEEHQEEDAASEKPQEQKKRKILSKTCTIL